MPPVTCTAGDASSVLFRVGLPLAVRLAGSGEGEGAIAGWVSTDDGVLCLRIPVTGGVPSTRDEVLLLLLASWVDDMLSLAPLKAGVTEVAELAVVVDLGCRARVNWDPSSRPKSLASISSCSSTPLMRSSWSGTATLVCRTSVLLILETESLRRSERLTAMVSRLRSTVEYT